MGQCERLHSRSSRRHHLRHRQQRHLHENTQQQYRNSSRINTINYGTPRRNLASLRNELQQPDRHLQDIHRRKTQQDRSIHRNSRIDRRKQDNDRKRFHHKCKWLLRTDRRTENIPKSAHRRTNQKRIRRKLR